MLLGIKKHATMSSSHSVSCSGQQPVCTSRRLFEFFVTPAGAACVVHKRLDIRACFDVIDGCRDRQWRTAALA